MIEGLQSKYLDENDLLDLGIGSVGHNVRVSEHATIVGLKNISLGNNIRIDSHVVILSKRGFYYRKLLYNFAWCSYFYCISRLLWPLFYECLSR